MRACALVALALIAAASGRAQDVTAEVRGQSVKDVTERVLAMRAELETKQAALESLKSAESSLVQSLGELDESIAKLDDERRAAAQKLSELHTEIASLEREAGLDEAELARLRGRLQARLRALVTDGDGGAARAMLGAEGFTELALRRHYLGRLADTDAKLIKDVRRVEASAVGKRQALVTRANEAQLLARLIDEQQSLLRATRDERRVTLERVRGERDVLKRAATELSARHRDLQGLVAKLGEGPRYKPPTGTTGMLRRSLLWPTDGALIRRFGSTVDKDTKAELVSNGIEVRADDGAVVAAVAAGRVVHTGWLRGFGRIIIVDHGEGHHTLSAHLSRAMVGRGDEVVAGQTIGFVGDTESQNGPKLYFELRENGRPRDPLPFLKRR